MAADILIYDSDIVPVGEDQVQHIEVCRDLAASFNHEFGETFVLPKAKLLDTSARVPGIDGEKMSKSYGNTLEVFEEPEGAAEADHADRDRLAADGAAEGAGDRPPLSSSTRCLPTTPQREAMAATYRRGGFGYGEVKKALADLAVDYFAEARERRKELEAHPERVREILGDGAARAPRRPPKCCCGPKRACGVKLPGQ